MVDEGEGKRNIDGSTRAAILLMSIGETEAAQILKLLAPKEVQKVGAAMASISNVEKSVVSNVLDEFISAVDSQASIVGSEEYIKNLLISALGQDKGNQVIDRILSGHSSKGLESLKWMEPKDVFELIKREHPQIIAIVLSYLDPDHAAEILSLMPDRRRADTVMRIATLEGIQPAALNELDRILDKQFYGNKSVPSSHVGGKKTAANILNLMDTSVESEILDEVKEADADLGQELEELMFVFDNILDINDRGIQALLREITSETLVLALKGADSSVTDKIYRNMSKRASQMLREDLDARGPVRVSDVEAAQKEILAIARRLMEVGQLTIGGKGEAYL